MQEKTEHLYRILEMLSRSGETDATKNAVSDFEKFFRVLKEKPDSTEAMEQLTKPCILHQTITITDKQRKQREFCVNGESLLLRAISIQRGYLRHGDRLEKIIECIMKQCPNMIVVEKTVENNKTGKDVIPVYNGTGVTPAHMAIFHEDKVLLKKMATILKQHDKNQLKFITQKKNVGNGLQDTPMMAGTLIGMASLMFNEKIFKIILHDFQSDMDVTNEKGDNLIHSLIKYASIKPAKLGSILKMISFVVNCEFITNEDGEEEDLIHEAYFIDNERKFRNQVKNVLMMKNREKLTPLQLAAKGQYFAIFEIIINHETYFSPESNDGLFHENSYDITEIETFPLTNHFKDFKAENEDNKAEAHESVLEYVMNHHKTNGAFLFTNITPVKEVIREKWNHYRPWFLACFFIYFIFIVLLSYAAVLRSCVEGSVPETKSVQYVYLVTENGFVTFVSILGLLFSFKIILLEFARWYYHRFTAKFSTKISRKIYNCFFLPYSNFMFRLYFIVFAILLISDFIFATMKAQGIMSGYENFCLIFSVLFGWYLVLFFLQIFKIISFYTLLIQRVLIDMIKFAFLIGILLVAFSIAMHMIMQGANTDSEDFKNLSKTIVKMFTIMVGMGELNILFQARQPILAIFVFVLFVLFTTVLLLNALIAMMSNSCTDLMKNHEGVVATKMHYRLQKLSMIIFLESFLPRKFCKEIGKENKGENEQRRRIVTHKSLKEMKEAETEIEMTTFEEPVQLTDLDFKIISSNDLLETISHGIKESITRESSKGKKRVATSSKQKPNPTKKRIEISDIEQSHCMQCDNQMTTVLQTQEITETLS